MDSIGACANILTVTRGNGTSSAGRWTHGNTRRVHSTRRGYIHIMARIPRILRRLVAARLSSAASAILDPPRVLRHDIDLFGSGVRVDLLGLKRMALRHVARRLLRWARKA